jgi:uncharacterized membrane protein YfcA
VRRLFGEPLTPAVFTGSLIGKRFDYRLNIATFRRIIYAVLWMASVLLLQHV